MSWETEKVLVTGGSGFLGVNLVRCLIEERGVPAASIRTFSDRSSSALDELRGIEVRTGTICDADAVRDACRGCTLVFHTAGSTTFDPRLRRQQWLVNVEGTRAVVEAVRASATARRLCHTSTVNVLAVPSPPGALGTEDGCSPYDGRPRLHAFRSADEALALADAVHAGAGPRGWWRRLGIGYFDSKLAAQELVNRAARRDGLDVVSVLPGTFFGPGVGFLGPSQLLLGVLRGSIPAVPRGGLPLAHVRDVARGHILAMERGRPGELYIISGRPEDNRTYRDMMSIIAEALRERDPGRAVRSRFPVIPPAAAWLAAAGVELGAWLSGRPTEMSRAAARVSALCAFYSSEKAGRDLGYRPQHSFREAVGDMIDELTRRGALTAGRSGAGARR